MKKTTLLIVLMGSGFLALNAHAMDPDQEQLHTPYTSSKASVAEPQQEEGKEVLESSPSRIPNIEKMPVIDTRSDSLQIAWHERSKIDSWIDREHYNSILSTQVLARERAEEISAGKRTLGIDRWGLITTNEQTGGIGQHKRTWVSPTGYNVYATYMIPWPVEHNSRLIHVPQTVTLAIAESIENYGLPTNIKWVNDLLIVKGEKKGKKISGVLSENKASIPNAQHSLCLVGIGINVNTPPECFEGIGQPVTSLFIETGRVFDKEKVLHTLSDRLFERLQSLINFGFEHTLLSEINARLAYKGRRVYIEDEDTSGNNVTQTYGVLKGLDKFGGAILETDIGHRTFYNGRLFPTEE